MVRRFVLLLLAAALGCAADPEIRCDTDDNCPSSLSCFGGICSEFPPPDASISTLPGDAAPPGTPDARPGTPSPDAAATCASSSECPISECCIGQMCQVHIGICP